MNGSALRCHSSFCLKAALYAVFKNFSGFDLVQSAVRTVQENKEPIFSVTAKPRH